MRVAIVQPRSKVPRWGRRPQLLGALALGFAGCAVAPPRTVQTFRAPPAGWQELRGGTQELTVQDGHLELSGTRACVDSVRFDRVEAQVDMALVSSDLRSFAGVFLEDTSDPNRGYHALAVQQGGSVRVYRSRDPGDPLGGSGWRPPAGEPVAGYRRLGIRLLDDEVELTLDGQAVGRTALESGRPTVPGAGRFRIGVFTRGAVARFKSFLGVTPGAPGPAMETLVDWGDAGLGQAQLYSARQAGKSFVARPSLVELHGLLASLEEAARSMLAAGDAQGLQSVRSAGERLARDTQPGARRLGVEDVQVKAFARIASLAGAAGAPRPSAKPTRSQEDPRLAALRDLPPLRLSFEVQTARRDDITRKGDFWSAVHEHYGGLERAAAGELKIHVEVLRAQNEEETSQTERRVASGQDGARLAARQAELRELEASFAENRLDAEARANVLRSTGKTLGGAVLGMLKTFEIEGKSVELQIDDGNALVKTAARLAGLRREIQTLGGKQSASQVSLPATLHTSSILLEIAYTVELDGKRVAAATRERTYLGIEQWTHGARKDLGVNASRYERSKVEAAIADVRARALRRFRTIVEPRGILAALDPAVRLGFVVRLARATGSEEDLMSLQWALRTELGLEGAELERAARELIRAGARSQ